MRHREAGLNRVDDERIGAADVVAPPVRTDQLRGRDAGSGILDQSAGNVDHRALRLQHIREGGRGLAVTDTEAIAKCQRAALGQELVDALRDVGEIAGTRGGKQRRANPGLAIGAGSRQAEIDRHGLADQVLRQRRVGDVVGRHLEGVEIVGHRARRAQP